MSSVFGFAELGQLWEKYHPQLLSMLERRIDPALRQRLGAEDVLQETYLVAQRRWEKYRSGSPLTPYAWFYRLALDTLYAAWQREHRAGRNLHHHMPYPDRSSIQLGLKIMSPGTKPSEAFTRQELRERVTQALDLLPEQRRQVLWMRHVDELSIAEICSVLDLHERTVYRELKRAVQQLKAIWRQLHPQGEQP